MKQQLQNLRAKPEHVRRQYAYTSAAAISLSIFLIWGVTFVVTKPLAYKPDQKQQVEQQVNPFADFAGTLRTGFAGVGASIEQINTEFEQQGQYEGPARLEIVETDRSSTIEDEPKERETVLTF